MVTEEVLRLSADSPESLLRLLDRPGAQTSGGTCRLAVVGPTERRLAAARKIVERGKSWQGRNDVWFSPRPLFFTEPGAKTVFVFPGLEGVFDPRCEDVARHFGLEPPKMSTENVLAYAESVTAVGGLLDTAVRRLGVRPDAMAGHSVGEWTAMVAAGMYRPDDVRRLRIRHWPRGFTPPEVDFVVLGCSAAEAGRRIEDEPGLVLSHDNSPHQSIVCGEPDAVARVVRAVRADGVVAKVLPFRSGFHTPMIGLQLDRFRRLITELDLRPPTVPIWSATTARPYPADLGEVRSLYLEHLVAPVLFRELVKALYVDGFRVFVQMGPGQLGSFVSDTVGSRPHLNVSANSGVRSGMDQLRRVAAAVWAEGGSPDFAVLEGAQQSPVPDGRADEVIAEFTALLEDTRAAAVSVLAASRPVPRFREVTLSVSMGELPYLRDHRFFRQRADWPDETDRRPVVPATTLIELAMAEVRRAWPGPVAVAVHNARFHRWLIAAPACRVPIRMDRVSPERVDVQIGAFASMTIELAQDFPRPPGRRELPVVPECRPPMSAEEIYTRREMFHGPEFRGLSEISGIGRRSIRGEITVPPAPGGLLDNAGQLLGCWLMATETERLLAFPRSIRRISFFGVQPAVGERLDCSVQVRTPDPATLEMDAWIVHKGRVWADIDGWQDVRFACDRPAHRAYAFPDRHHLSTRTPDGWSLIIDRWPGVATRDIYAGVYLSAPERAEYARSAPLDQAKWLLRRIAVKDAVRALLAEAGETGIYPAEIRVSDDPHGGVRISGHLGRKLPELAISLEQHGDSARAKAEVVIPSVREVGTW